MRGGLISKPSGTEGREILGAMVAVMKMNIGTGEGVGVCVDGGSRSDGVVRRW